MQLSLISYVCKNKLPLGVRGGVALALTAREDTD